VAEVRRRVHEDGLRVPLVSTFVGHAFLHGMSAGFERGKGVGGDAEVLMRQLIRHPLVMDPGRFQ